MNINEFIKDKNIPQGDLDSVIKREKKDKATVLSLQGDIQTLMEMAHGGKLAPREGIIPIIKNILKISAEDRFKSIFGCYVQDLKFDSLISSSNQTKSLHKIDFHNPIHVCLDSLMLLEREKEYLQLIGEGQEIFKGYQKVDLPKEMHISKLSQISTTEPTLPKLDNIEDLALWLNLVKRWTKKAEDGTTTTYFVMDTKRVVSQKELFIEKDSAFAKQLKACLEWIKIHELFTKNWEQITASDIACKYTKRFPDEEYLDNLVPLYAGGVKFRDHNLSKWLALLQGNDDGAVIQHKKSLYAPLAEIQRLFDKNQLKQQELYELIHHKLKQLVKNKNAQQVDRLRFQAFPEALYVDEKKELAKKLKEEKELKIKELERIKKQQELIKGEELKKKRETKLKPSFKKIPQHTEIVPEAKNVEIETKKTEVEFTPISQPEHLDTSKIDTPKIQSVAKKILTKSYQPIKDKEIIYDKRVRRWFKTRSDKPLYFEKYRHLDPQDQQKAKFLHGFSQDLDPLIFDKRFYYEDGKSRHLLVAFELEDGTLDMGVTSYNLEQDASNKDKFHCMHRFHSKCTPLILMEKGITNFVKSKMSEVLHHESETKEEEIVEVEMDDFKSEGYLENVTHRYVTLDDPKWHMKIHVFEKIPELL